MRLIVVVLLATFFFLNGCDPQGKVLVENLSVEEAVRLLESESNLFVLDVRTAEEWATGVIPEMDGAVDWRQWDRQWVNFADKPDPGQPVLVYCHSGRRAADAAEWLAGAGYSRVYNLGGGISGWQAAGLPVVQLSQP